MEDKEKLRNNILLSIFINIIWLAVCVGAILITMIYKDVPIQNKHLFSDLHSYRIFVHSSITALYFIVGTAINVISYSYTKDIKKKEEPKE